MITLGGEVVLEGVNLRSSKNETHRHGLLVLTRWKHSLSLEVCEGPGELSRHPEKNKCVSTLRDTIAQLEVKLHYVILHFLILKAEK